MKLLCAKCEKPILDANINIKEGFAYCNYCDEFFRIANSLIDARQIKKVQKPPFTNVTIERKNGETRVSIPSFNKYKGSASAAALFLGFWFFVAGLAFFINDIRQGNFGEAFWIFLFFVVMPVVSSAYYFYDGFYGNIDIVLTQTQVTVRSKVFGYPVDKIRSFADIRDIVEDIEYRGQGYQPIVKIAFVLPQGARIKFGKNLLEDERKWLLAELYDIWTDLKLENANS